MRTHTHVHAHPIPLSILSLLFNNPNTEEEPDGGKEEAALWHIWMERNRSIYNKKL